MKDETGNEIYSSNEDNACEEYSFFPAEDYKAKELSKEAKEHFEVDEFSLGKEPDRKEKEKISNYDRLKDHFISHAPTIAATTAIGVISASVLGFVPGISEEINSKSPFGSVLVDSLVDRSSFHQISIEGDMEKSEDVLRYYALVEEWGEEGKEEEFYGELDFVEDHFTFATDVFYGVQSYRYKILAFNGSEEENVVYFSPVIPFTFDQSYQGSYQKIKPTEAKIQFGDSDSYTVEIETGYQSPYPDIFQYEVSAVTKEGVILDRYVGFDSTVTLHVPYGENLYLLYKDISYFANEEIVSQQYMTSDYSVVSLPSLSFADEFGFDGQNFTLSYRLDTVYEQNNFQLNLHLDNGIAIKEKKIGNLTKDGTIILDDYAGEIGNLTLSGELEFHDNRLDGNTHKVPIVSKNYDMKYRLEVTSLTANLIDVTDYIPLSFDFDYLLPSDYSIAIYNEDRSINENFDPKDSYYLKKIASGDGGILSVAILAPDGTEFRKVGDYTVHSFDEIKSAYQEPAFSNCVNPGDSVVTYNEDNTVNLYRKVDFSAVDPHVYLDTMLYETMYEEAETGEIKYLNAKHSRTTGTYSAMENLTALDYCFLYFVNFEKDGVVYQMSKEMPSGSLDLVNGQPIRYEAGYDETTDSTKLIIYNDSYYYIKNEILIDGNYYYFTDYTEYADSYVAFIPGNVQNKTMQLSMTLYDTYYESYSADCSMKGARYKTYSFNI